MDWKKIGKEIYDTRLTNYYYWLKIMMMILAVALTQNMSFWITAIFIGAIFGFINYEYPDDLKASNEIEDSELHGTAVFPESMHSSNRGTASCGGTYHTDGDGGELDDFGIVFNPPKK
jgi:hypothetical protein